MKKVHSLELKKYKVFRELEFPLCSFEIKNGFVIRLNYNLINNNKILKEEIS